ncbi:hypothetical protein CH375_16600 [Leptospira ellisii]|uniref:Uncharacterized protein n=1 Tax=Leptospira ellisii TaxID=2023197 RepID=A0A2N0B6E7_9LEPT|nr:hypothetical protein CH379_14860 [Leptospira ellisii]PKA03502.1 hypothetical protein CH375_16600 [Leptospira ellisii]
MFWEKTAWKETRKRTQMKIRLNADPVPLRSKCSIRQRVYEIGKYCQEKGKGKKGFRRVFDPAREGKLHDLI